MCADLILVGIPARRRRRVCPAACAELVGGDLRPLYLAWLSAYGMRERGEGGRLNLPVGSPLQVVASHRDLDGELLDPRTAAVELLSIVRPTVAVAWFVTFAALALHTYPGWRARLADENEGLLEAFAHEIRRLYRSPRPSPTSSSPRCGAWPHFAPATPHLQGSAACNGADVPAARVAGNTQSTRSDE